MLVDMRSVGIAMGFFTTVVLVKHALKHPDARHLNAVFLVSKAINGANLHLVNVAPVQMRHVFPKNALQMVGHRKMTHNEKSLVDRAPSRLLKQP